MTESRNTLLKAAAIAVLVAAAMISIVWADVATPRPRWTAVRLESETVDITLGEKRVAVEAVFHMYNEGKAGKVRMGYPLGVFEKQLHDFQVTVAGKLVKGIRTETNPGSPSRGGGRAPGAFGGKGGPMPTGGAPGGLRRTGRAGRQPGVAAEPYRFDGTYKQWKVWDVAMGANEPKTIKVTYWVEPARIADAKKNPLLHYTYTLRTGATWKGKITQAVVRVKLDGVTPARIVRRVPVGAVAGKDGKTFTWTFRDFKPVDNIDITYRPSRPVRTALAGGK